MLLTAFLLAVTIAILNIMFGNVVFGCAIVFFACVMVLLAAIL